MLGDDRCCDHDPRDRTAPAARDALWPLRVCSAREVVFAREVAAAVEPAVRESAKARNESHFAITLTDEASMTAIEDSGYRRCYAPLCGSLIGVSHLPGSFCTALRRAIGNAGVMTAPSTSAAARSALRRGFNEELTRCEKCNATDRSSSRCSTEMRECAATHLRLPPCPPAPDSKSIQRGP